MPQLMIRCGTTLNQAESQPPPPKRSRPPSWWSSARPRISIPRGVHGSTLARSSTAKATFGLACRSRHFFDPLSPCPPISMVSAWAPSRKPTGTICGAPPPPTVASRPSRYPRRYSISFSVNGLTMTSSRVELTAPGSRHVACQACAGGRLARHRSGLAWPRPGTLGPPIPGTALSARHHGGPGSARIRSGSACRSAQRVPPWCRRHCRRL